MYDTISQYSRKNMQDAANALQWHIYEGLCVNIDEEITIFNILPVGSFPQYYKYPFVCKSNFVDNNCNHTNIGFCNIKLIRKWFQIRRIYSTLKRWYLKDDEPKTLFVYTISATFTNAVEKLKRKYRDLNVCAIVADLPNMSSLSSNKKLANKLFERWLAADSYSKIYCIDSFVLLTKQMAEYMNIDKPYVVMEGIATYTEVAPKTSDTALKIILYTGTLHRKFGVLNLIEAFSMIDDSNYRLVICGIGDSEAEIRVAAAQDSRIIFKGQIKREEALKLQQEATVLVNPRQNNQEFTKYSFPSKNLEYLSSGIPLVAYKLDGIPDEYDEYINYVSDNSPETLSKVLVNICELPMEDRVAMGNKARKFVYENKNSVEQTKRIIALINSSIKI